ncbi:MAG: dihydrolipoyllysine-residue acetyltransferase [Methyloligellaceae bacterium]
MSTPIEVTVPDIGDFQDVEIIEVNVAAGDSIAEEDPVITLESDKASMEVPSPASGVVKELKVSVGDRVSEGMLILLLDAGEAAAPVEPPSPKGVQEPDSAPPAAALAPAAAAAPQSQAPAATNLAPVDEAGFAGAHASPSVRAFARQLGIDLAKLRGTGRKGRILRDDVTAYFKGEASAAAPAGGGMGIPPVPATDFSKFGEVEEVALSRIKRISGPVLHRSWLNVPHVTHQEEADITELDQFRRELDAKAKDDGYRITLLSFAIKACISALKQHPEFNSSLHPDGDKLIHKKFYNIGIAVDTSGGLVVPIVKNADSKGIVEISKELGETSKRARDGKLSAEDMQGATFTISSLGGIGGTGFTPIVNAPEVAILGLTRSKMTPVWDGEQFVPRNMLPMSLSYDHRAIDGALAARFAASLKTIFGDIRRILL